MFKYLKRMFKSQKNILSSNLQKKNIDQYDEALIIICLINRVKLSSHNFYDPDILEQTRLNIIQKYHKCFLNFNDLNLLLNTHLQIIINGISTRRNHHWVLFQFLVRLLSTYDGYTDLRKDLFCRLGKALLTEFDHSVVEAKIKSWTNPIFDRCFHVYYSDVGYYRSFSSNFYQNSFRYRNQELADFKKALKNDDDCIWFILNYGKIKFQRYKSQYDREAYRSQYNNWKNYNNTTTYHTVDKTLLTRCFQILEMNPSSDPKVIKKAYRQMCLKYHPDKGGSQEKFILITKSYEYLMKYV